MFSPIVGGVIMQRRNALSMLLCFSASLAMAVASHSQDSQASQPSNTSAQPASAHAEPALALASAESVYLAAELGGAVRHGLGRGFPSVERAQAGLRDAIAKWGRFTIVDAPEKADLVLVIVEGNRTSGIRAGALTERLLVSAGGPDSEESALLWQSNSHDGGVRDYRPIAKTVDEFRAAVEEYDKKITKDQIAEARAVRQSKAESRGCGDAQVNPFDCVFHGNSRLFLPEDREENQGAVRLSEVVMHLSLADSQRRVSATEFSNYVVAIQKLLHHQFSAESGKPGKDLALVATLQPDGKADFQLASRPQLEQEQLQKFYDALVNLPKPAIKDSPLEFRAVFLLWGGSEYIKTER